MTQATKKHLKFVIHHLPHLAFRRASSEMVTFFPVAVRRPMGFNLASNLTSSSLSSSSSSNLSPTPDALGQFGEELRFSTSCVLCSWDETEKSS